MFMRFWVFVRTSLKIGKIFYLLDMEVSVGMDIEGRGEGEDTYVLSTGKRENLDGPRRYEAGRELDQVHFSPRRHILERTEISRNDDHNQIRYSRQPHHQQHHPKRIII